MGSSTGAMEEVPPLRLVLALVFTQLAFSAVATGVCNRRSATRDGAWLPCYRLPGEAPHRWSSRQGEWTCDTVSKSGQEECLGMFAPPGAETLLQEEVGFDATDA